jgi:hypothetical protein
VPGKHRGHVRPLHLSAGSRLENFPLQRTDSLGALLWWFEWSFGLAGELCRFWQRGSETAHCLAVHPPGWVSGGVFDGPLSSL